MDRAKRHKTIGKSGEVVSLKRVEGTGLFKTLKENGREKGNLDTHEGMQTFPKNAGKVGNCSNR